MGRKEGWMDGWVEERMDREKVEEGSEGKKEW